MAGTITTGSHPKALWPGIDRWFGMKYRSFPTQYTDIFEVRRSSKKYEENVETTGFGLAQVKPEGGAITYDSHEQGYTKRYTHVVYGLGYIVTQEEMEDNLYREVSMARSEGLAFSMRTTKEIVAANVLNRAFNSSYTGGDGKELLATDHPTLSGTFSNELATPADLSEAALEDLLIQIRQTKNARDLQISITGRKLIVPPNLMFDAERILMSTLQPGTANNDINAMRSSGMLREGYVVNDYLTDEDAWFVRTDCPVGMVMYERRALQFGQDNDFDTSNAKAKATERYSVGWTDPRGMFGSAGS